MLRHTGQRRTFKHNVRLAGLLCLTAGFVNVAGLLGFVVLTTNVTGHVALFAEKLAEGDFGAARVVAFWMFSYFFGAFCSSMYIKIKGRNKRFVFTVPILLEISIFLVISFFSDKYDKTVLMTELFAGSLLFAMGMQNALVSVISGFVVRTTHLTGMFTDLAIDTSSMIFPEGEEKILRQRVLLRSIIIFFFFLGGIAGGFLFKYLAYKIFLVPAGILVIALFYDIFRVRFIKAYRRVIKIKR